MRPEKGAKERLGKKVTTNARFKKVRLIPGENGSRFPFCTSLFIDDEEKVIIDPGAGTRCLGTCVDFPRVRFVLNTHYHFDHISGNHLFPNARVFINQKEFEVLKTREKVAERLARKGHEASRSFLEKYQAFRRDRSI